MSRSWSSLRQNPVEQEGTYPLPEAQLDRFMFLIAARLSLGAEEIQIARTTTGEDLPRLDHLLTPGEVIVASKPGAASSRAGSYLRLRRAAWPAKTRPATRRPRRG